MNQMPRQTLSAERIRELAKEGAAKALAQLKAEIVALERTFPELAGRAGRARVAAQVRERTRTMSAAARKEVSARMKKYWAERRKAQSKTK
jgi:CelD/BcsL family acetyltransferase involved in cellulose biosynthesis